MVGLRHGSGIVVAPGRVLTNAQNLRGAEVTVSFPDGRREPGTVAGRELDLDLAAVQVDTGDVTPVEWEPDSVRVAVGDPVVALASPEGAELIAVPGAVTAVDSVLRGPRGQTIPGCLEHDARPRPGLGGTPLADLAGRLLGLNSVRLHDGRIGAVPAGATLAARLELLWTAGGRRPLRAGAALAADQTHPIFERIEVLADEPPYDRSVVERLGLTRLHVGCGPNMLRRWLNTDRKVYVDEHGGVSPVGRIVRAHSERYRERHFLSQDALDPYPFEDGAFDVVYSEHFIEHVPRRAAVAWLREVRRLLRPGGFVRLVTPDLRRYVDGYRDPAGAFFAEHREVLRAIPQFADEGVPETRGFMVNQIFRYFGHQWIYDLDEMRAAAGEAGFDPGAVIECAFAQGRLAEVAALDQESHSDESLYVEVVRT